MKIVVTGAAGFIATSLLPRLLNSGDEVHGVDNYFLGKREFVAYQASRRGGTLRVRLDGDRVKLGGHAVTVLRGELTV